MSSRPLDSREFFRLLQQRTARSAGRIDRILRERAEREVTVFVCDTSGFTRKTHAYGIAHFLAVMTRGYRSIHPLLQKRRGLVVSQAADNLIALFPDPANAVRASIDIQRKLRRFNVGKHDADQFHLSIGIETGPAMVLIDNVYGATVNVAAKIGEDLAGKGEILVTGGVAKLVKRAHRCTYDRSAELGGRAFEIFRVPY
ncbi:MAG TPA: adenylate/guanylate cyclase domain-containing protein [Planctomycetota bacterium]|nr:adenylate/guanylate cyclase domain-containing protein [Planctomycetota bacterium]